MLVLTRKVGESIKINEDVKITVIDVKGKNIRLGIEAPRETKIYREEVFLRIKEELPTCSATAARFRHGHWVSYDSGSNFRCTCGCNV